ncbi:MAG: TonB family protein [Proteobacteria bacterium]|nr:TonB family protein [Pseudomonadota bacterium]MBK7114912.1 TonB family protein [Pseudomonadota bacterium]MBK9251963.1 TonB family protein [Pseudomonadota bacterium]MCC6631385.1 TonB family protein [Gammaproteobacteria bacterium]
MVLAPFYRSYELPWEGDPDSARRFRRLVTIGLVLFVLGGIIIPFLKLPVPKETAAQAVPDRLARLMVEEKPKPPPPPPPPPKPIEPPKPETKPIPQPVDRTVEARKKAEKQLDRVKDELADLRRDLAQELPIQTKNLTGAVGAESKAERSLIASKAGTGSAGVQSTNSSRGFGSGAGSLTGHTTTSVSSRVASIGADNKASRTGSSGKAARSQEEIELEFDRNKGAIYALYSRALRERPELQGKMVLEFTIAPSGEVTACRVVSSELGDPELERKIVARVKLIRFAAKDVEPMTTTKPIEFFPA